MAAPASFQVRAAVPGDTPELLALIRHYWDFEGIENFAALRIELVLRRLFADPQLGGAWIAESGGAFIGYLIAVTMLSLEHGGIMAEIDELFVRPEARSNGVGAQLLATAEGELARRGCVRLQLQLGVGNEAARAFYERRGYRPREGYELLDKPLGAA